MSDLRASTYRFYRATVNKTDDPDWVTNQTDINSIPYYTVQRVESAGSGAGRRSRLEVVLEWLDANNAVVAAGLGTFDATPIKIMAREYNQTTTPSGNMVVDGAGLTGQEAQKPFIIDDIMPGDRVAVRLTNMVQAAATKARLMVREMNE